MTQPPNSPPPQDLGALDQTLRAAELAQYVMRNTTDPQARDIAAVRYARMLDKMFMQLQAMRRGVGLSALSRPAPGRGD
ncbi:hypothetical protein [Actibacterium sp. XHP0104]|uniref:hypothetical protein n=1 Tax=Actibacterium sp. XHP0104 TaxID=2984335 RepID=UPI0021E7F41E|nr:hypothetical protein [Actibacterium sp. XHP0104]MCV2880547.1 hypothetical protein [Actibacterium sp. XHP0104]